jgi:translocation and assembly module TamB
VRALRWLGLSVAVLLLAVFLFAAWVLSTPAGATWLVARVQGALAGKLTVGAVAGQLTGPLTLTDVRFDDPQTGLAVHIGRASVDVALSALLSRELHVRSVVADDLQLRLPERSEPSTTPSRLSLQPPIDVLLDRFELNSAHLQQQNRTVLVIDRADLAGSWTTAGIKVRELAVSSPDGTVRFAGDVATQGYAGGGSGEFSWRVRELVYTGTLKATGEPGTSRFALHLSAPFAADLSASLGHARQLPWTLALRVPRFDPRDQLLPKSPLKSLATSLDGAGDRASAQVRGTVTVNDEQALIDTLRLRVLEHEVRIDALTLKDPHRTGTLQVTGSVGFQPRPFYANLAARVSDVTLPAAWVGQEMRAGGNLLFRGNTSTFDVDGRLSVGPEAGPADISVAIAGSPRVLDVRRLEVVQEAGHLSASGKLELQPAIRWKFSATAQQFDPGVLVAGWPGKLDLALNTQGETNTAGLTGSLDLKRLSGTLRRRSVDGHGNVTLSPAKVMAGSLYVQSGKTVLQVTGRRGTAMDAHATLSIGDVEDWLAGAEGKITARMNVSGRWPDFAIVANAHGDGLEFDSGRVRTVDLSANIRNPLHPSGAVHLSASDLGSGGLTFSSLDVEGSGSESAHSLRLEAKGPVLSVQLRGHGARHKSAWSGAVDALVLDAPDTAHLVLQQPARIAFDPHTFSVSRSCLTGTRVNICASAERNAAGELHAQYTLEHLPLGLLAALGKQLMPVRAKGSLEGQGEVRMTADGAWLGNATLTSTSGRLTEAGDDNEVLISYSGLDVELALNGDEATARASARVNDTGTIDAQGSVSGLRGVEPAIQAHVVARLPDLAPVGLFVPQLSNIGGRGDATLDVSGSLHVPKVIAAAHVAAFSAELPQLALQLREGVGDARVDDSGLTLSGAVKSGDGQLNFTGGNAQQDGDSADRVLKVHLTGKDFMAANIPGARVVVAPELDVSRTASRIDITGTVDVTSANIELEKLPKSVTGGSGALRPSPDVIIVDEPEQQQRARLYADIKFRLGHARPIKLTGMGLDATVQGDLQVLESPGEVPLGSGDISVIGTFRAYGQDLTIRQGHLLYARTPLNNPQLSITAVREATNEVTAQLQVTGSARNPILNVSADQNMSSTQALSYLVTGKSATELTGNESSMVQSAAQSLGNAAGNMAAQSIGKRLGISNVGIENNEAVGGSAFMIGQYLSPSLYLSYGVGLFEPGQVVTLRYRLNDRLSVDASQGTQQSRAGINFRTER